jgi:hypothetical protein
MHLASITSGLAEAVADGHPEVSASGEEALMQVATQRRSMVCSRSCPGSNTAQYKPLQAWLYMRKIE